jgi:hypothetical protein
MLTCTTAQIVIFRLGLRKRPGRRSAVSGRERERPRGGEDENGGRMGVWRSRGADGVCNEWERGASGVGERSLFGFDN